MLRLKGTIISKKRILSRIRFCDLTLCTLVQLSHLYDKAENISALAFWLSVRGHQVPTEPNHFSGERGRFEAPTTAEKAAVE